MFERFEKLVVWVGWAGRNSNQPKDDLWKSFSSAKIMPGLHLQLPSTFSVAVDPVVVLAVLDAHLRRQSDQDRVVGTLLGVRSDDGSEIVLKSCFCVPHSENEDEVRRLCSRALT
jgi:hypothetical protein